jgi:hypothetical protein
MTPMACPPAPKHGVGDSTHQADAAAAEHQLDVARGHLIGQPFGGLAIGGSGAGAGSAEHADAPEDQATNL